MGAIFVLGDRRTLSPHLRQLILNPFKGHGAGGAEHPHSGFPEDVARIGGDGRRVCRQSSWRCGLGRNVSGCVRRAWRLRPGLGARHAAALAIPP